MDEEITKLQTDIHELEKNIRFTDVEKKITEEENSCKIKENESEIKQLNMQMKELDVRIKKFQKADENIIVKALDENGENLSRFKGKSAKETIKMLESRVLELQKNIQTIDKEVQIKKRHFECCKVQYDEVSAKYTTDIKNDSTEYESLQRMRKLEKEQDEINKFIMECEIAQSRFKTMREQLQKNRFAYPLMYLELERDLKAHTEATEYSEMGDNLTVGNLDEVNSLYGSTASLEKAIEMKKDLSSPMKNLKLAVEAEQRVELKSLQENLRKIKHVTGVHDTQDAEHRFLMQKTMQKDLMDLKQRVSKYLYELKVEKKELESKLQLLSSSYTEDMKRDRENNIKSANERFAGQEKRKASATAELEKLTALISDAEEKLITILKKLADFSPEDGRSLKSLTAHETFKMIEDRLFSQFDTNYKQF